MLYSNSIGNKIAMARKKINLSQAELAQQVSISAQAVGKWERGESMPDILTLNRLAEILGVDLNYFSENFGSTTSDEESVVFSTRNETDFQEKGPTHKKNWDMSKLNLTDSDFSGLKNLHEKFSSSNMQRCLFIGSDLSGLVLDSNNIDSCDFSDSDVGRSRFRNSNLEKDVFKNTSLIETEFSKCNISSCDFSGADFTKTQIKACNFSKNNLEKSKWLNTSFSETYIQETVFEGKIDSCFFESCGFNKVKFENCILINTFFKNNKRIKKVEFINCKADKITYAFLKTNQADLSGVSLLE